MAQRNRCCLSCRIQDGQFGVFVTRFTGCAPFVSNEKRTAEKGYDAGDFCSTGDRAIAGGGYPGVDNGDSRDHGHKDMLSLQRMTFFWAMTGWSFKSTPEDIEIRRSSHLPVNPRTY